MKESDLSTPPSATWALAYLDGSIVLASWCITFLNVFEVNKLKKYNTS